MNDVNMTAFVKYVQPSYEELRHQFPQSRCIVFSGYERTRLAPIERCKTVSKQSREVTFEYVYMGRKASSDEILAEMDRKGLRPALYEELLGFAEKYNSEQWTYPLVALGSLGITRGCRVACVYWSLVTSTWFLDMPFFSTNWRDEYRFLAVRE